MITATGRPAPALKTATHKKILNVTTKADRSVGTTGRLTAQAGWGNDDRYNAQLFVQRIKRQPANRLDWRYQEHG